MLLCSEINTVSYNTADLQDRQCLLSSYHSVVALLLAITASHHANDNLTDG